MSISAIRKILYATAKGLGDGQAVGQAVKRGSLAPLAKAHRPPLRWQGYGAPAAWAVSMNRFPERSECDEVADNMAPVARLGTFDNYLRYCRAALRGESETVICNVAESLWRREKHD